MRLWREFYSLEPDDRGSSRGVADSPGAGSSPGHWGWSQKELDTSRDAVIDCLGCSLAWSDCSSASCLSALRMSAARESGLVRMMKNENSGTTRVSSTLTRNGFPESCQRARWK